MLSNLVPNVPVSVKINLVYASASMYIAVQEGIGQSSNLLYSTMTNGSVNFTFVPTQSSVQLSMELLFNKVPSTAFSYSFTLDTVSYTQQTGANSSTQLVQISNKQRDKYRFGFNGQEKDNEIAGVGNHNTALYWEYSTQTGIRWNRDPKKNEWESDYAVMQGNPILRSDVLGDYSRIGAWWRNIRDDGGGIHKSKGEWGYYTAKKDPNGDAINLKFHDGSKERDKKRFLSREADRWMLEEMGAPKDEDGNYVVDKKYEKWGFRERLKYFFDMSWPAFFAGAPRLAVAKAATAAEEGRAFFSGVGTEAKAIEAGYQTLGQTRAGQNLQNLITSKNIPWSGVNGAEAMWNRLSATWAKGVPNGSSVPVFLNNPRAGSVWFQTEREILTGKGVKLIYK